MKSYRLDIRIKNNLILKRVEEKYPSFMKFCEAHGLSVQACYPYLTYKKSPVAYMKNISRKKVEALNGFYWKPTALRMAKALNCSPFDIFPEETWQTKTNNRYQIEVGKNDLLPFYDGISQGSINDADYLKCDKVMEIALSYLTEREAEVIRERFLYGKTLAEVGKKQGVGPERIRQIEFKAVRKLRHPIARSKLKEYMYNDGINENILLSGDIHSNDCTLQ